MVKRSNPDQYQLRFPPGLRDRIKAYADKYGRSMNTEIIRVLEREYPEPWPINSRILDLLAMMDSLKAATADEAVDRLSLEVRETLEGIASGRVRGIDEVKRSEVRETLERWYKEETRDQEIIQTWDLDDEETEMLERTGSTQKYVDPPSED